MFLFRIYLGLDTNGHDVNSHELALKLAADCFPNGHTVINTLGRWNGAVGVVDEQTIVIEVITDSRAEGDLRSRTLAGDYKDQAYQESVLITCTEIDASFV